MASELYKSDSAFRLSTGVVSHWGADPTSGQTSHPNPSRAEAILL